MGSFNLIIKEWVVCVEKIWTIRANRDSNWSYDDLKNTLEAVGRVGMNGSENSFKKQSSAVGSGAKQQAISL